MLQLATAQVAVVPMTLHVGVPFCVVHAVVHAPQLPTVFRGVSHPFPSIMLAVAANKGAHASEHIPPLQLGLSFFVLQTLPQAPQLLGSVPVAVSQLVPGWEGQWA